MDDIQSKSGSEFTLSDHVAEELRALLARRRMSGRDLAKRLGTSPSWVSYRLTGTTEIGLTDLERIAAELGVEVADLLPAPARRSDNGGGTVKTPYPASVVLPTPHQLTSHGLVHATHDPHSDPRTETDTHIPPQSSHHDAGRRRGSARTQRVSWTHAR